jgi:hypothetical protein
MTTTATASSGSAWLPQHRGYHYLFFLLSIPVYAQRVYPFLPISIGGGSKITVRLITEKGSAETIGQVIEMQKGVTGVTVPVQLLDESDKFFFVLHQQPRGTPTSLRVDKSLVKIVEHELPAR